MPLCFVDKFPLNQLTINICQTHPFLQSFCQLWLVILSLNVFSFRVKKQITGLVECCNFGNLKHFASEALFVPLLNGISSFAIRTLSPGFKLSFLTCLLDCCAICKPGLLYDIINICILLFVLQMFVDDVFERSNNAVCKCRIRFTVCGVSVYAFAFTELFESPFELGSFIRPYFQRFSFGDHATKSFSSFLCTLSSPWLNSEFSWQYNNSCKKVFKTILVIS